MIKRRCEFCGEELERGDSFCKSCGNSVKKSEVVQDAIIDDPKKKNRSLNDNYIAIIIITVIVLALFFALLF